jgi:hypothetical protein
MLSKNEGGHPVLGHEGQELSQTDLQKLCGLRVG